MKMQEKPKKYIGQIKTYQALTQSVFELTFTSDFPLFYKAGQFISIIIPHAGPQGRHLRRAYSLASAPCEKDLRVCVKLVENGPGSHYLSQLRPNDHFEFWGSYGSFTWKTPENTPVCFIATGTGIAPFYAMMQEHIFTEPSFCLLGVRTANEILYEEQIQQMKKVQFIGALSQEKKPPFFSGRVTDYLKEHLMITPTMEFYLCGNGAMIKEIQMILQQKDVHSSRIHHEKYY
jgi:ferredoxin-NADP reductase